jgi:hypothetical protein
MLSKLISTVLAFFTAVSNFSGIFLRVADIEPPAGDFTPVLRFTAVSDTHIEFPGDVRCQRMAKMLKTSYAIAQADEHYKNLDGVMFAGDITDSGTGIQFLTFQSILNAGLKEGTQPMVIVAKSHDGNTYQKDALEFYESLSGLTTDFHYVLNGFHFIGISTTHDRDTDVKYTQTQLDWLDAQLTQAVADDPLKPVFVTHHEHVADTVYGSRESLGEGWSTPEFYGILARYPQVVDFSGHSHYPLNDPRSIWQGDFTALGTSSLNYFEFTVDDVRTVHPKNNKKAAQMWVVEADANNRVRLRGYDLIADAFVCEYLVENPSDKNSFAYTPEQMAANSSAPVFVENTQVKTKKLITGTYRVDIPAARSTDDQIIFIYRVYILDESGNPVSNFWELSGYYFTPPPETVNVNIGKLNKGSYTLKIVAENAYGKQSEPIIKTLAVK